MEGNTLTEVPTVRKNEEGFFVAPSDLPAHYMRHFNEMSRKHRFTFVQAWGLLAVFRLQHLSDLTYRELCAAETLTMKNRAGELVAHPLLDIFAQQVSLMGQWYRILGLLDLEDDAKVG